MPQRHWRNPRVVSSGYVAIRRFFHFEVAGGVRSSTSALVCVIPIMKINMVARGKAVRNAAISGRREITKPMRKTPSTGRDIEGGGERGPNPGHEN
jgi:hypothetical protein